MEKIILKNYEINNLFQCAYLNYWHKLNKTQIKLIKIIILRYNKYSNNEYLLYFTLIYLLLFFNSNRYKSKFSNRKRFYKYNP